MSLLRENGALLRSGGKVAGCAPGCCGCNTAPCSFCRQPGGVLIAPSPASYRVRIKDVEFGSGCVAQGDAGNDPSAKYDSGQFLDEYCVAALNGYPNADGYGNWCYWEGLVDFAATPSDGPRFRHAWQDNQCGVAGYRLTDTLIFTMLRAAAGLVRFDLRAVSERDPDVRLFNGYATDLCTRGTIRIYNALGTPAADYMEAIPTRNRTSLGVSQGSGGYVDLVPCCPPDDEEEGI
jgi:hypothetical protein